MTVWHWVRHGPTHQKTFTGWRDVPADLSDSAQVDRLHQYLPQTALLVSSDLTRCVETADALAAATRPRHAHQADLREIHFGLWDGMHFKDIAARDPVLSRRYWEEPGEVAPPGGESWDQTSRRVNAVVDTLNAAHPDRHIIAVAHFGVILTQVQRALGVSAYEAMSHKIDNLSVTTLHHDAGAWDVETINHVP